MLFSQPVGFVEVSTSTSFNGFPLTTDANKTLINIKDAELSEARRLGLFPSRSEAS